MENKIIKQKPEQFLMDTFKDTINYYGTKNAYVVARKLYIKTNNIITSIEFLGPTSMAFNNLVLTAIGKNGPKCNPTVYDIQGKQNIWRK